MHLATALRVLITSVFGFSMGGCATSPETGQKAPWRHVKEMPTPKPPRGKVITAEDGSVSVLTLPNGKKFTSRNDWSNTTLTFPNGQVFTAETAKGAFEPPYVSTDESLVASIVIPSTQSGNLHIFTLGRNGEYGEIARMNGKVAGLLREAGAPFGADALRILDLKDRTIALASVDFGQNRGEAYLFSIVVGRDGEISLKK